MPRTDVGVTARGAYAGVRVLLLPCVKTEPASTFTFAPLDAESLTTFAPAVKIRCSVEFQQWWCSDEELALITSYRAMAPYDLIEHMTEMTAAVEEEDDRVVARVAATDSRVEVLQQVLEKALVGDDAEQMQAARPLLAAAQQAASAADAQYDVVIMQEEPLTLTLMEEIADELDLAEEFGEEYADVE